jgi:hypothetical protein
MSQPKERLQCRRILHSLAAWRSAPLDHRAAHVLKRLLATTPIATTPIYHHIDPGRASETAAERRVRVRSPHRDNDHPP